MSSVIGSLRVNLGIDSAQFERGAKRAGSQLGSMKKQFLAVAGVAAAMGAAISKAALMGAKEIDRAAKAARRLDSSITGFRALELAASEAGVSLSSMTNDIQTMNRELASIGTSGNGARALDALGLSIDDLEGKDADEKLAIIADQVKSLGLSAGETTSILRDLGVRNREMALLVLSGGDAIRAARGDIESYGLAISDVDASRIEKANDAIGRLGLITQYAGQQLAIALVPAMGRLAEAMTESLREGGLLRAMIDGLVNNIDVLASTMGVAVTLLGVKLVVAMAAAAGATGVLSGAFIILRRAIFATGFGAIVIGAGVAVAWFGRLVKGAGSFGNALGLLKDVAVGVWEKIQAGAEVMYFGLALVFNDIQYAWITTIGKLSVAWGKFVDRIAGSRIGEMMGIDGGNEASAMGRLADEMRSTTDAMEGILGDLAAASSKLAGPVAGMEELRAAMAAAKEEMVAGEEASNDLRLALDDVGNSARGAAQEVDEITPALESSSSAMHGFESAGRSAFTQLVTGAKGLNRTLSDLLARFAEVLANSAFDSIIGEFSKSGKKGGGNGDLLSSAVSAVAGSFAGSFDGGGNIPRGQFGIAGERGMELVQGPAHITSRADTARMMGGGGGGVVVNVDARGAQQGVAEQITQGISRAIPEITAAVRSGINGRQSRGYSV